MDPATYITWAGLALLIFEKIFDYCTRIRRSSCVNGTFEVELADQPTITLAPPTTVSKTSTNA